MYPHERSLVMQLAGKPFVLLGVNSDLDRVALQNTLIDEQITWRSWWDDGRIDGPIQTNWQVDIRPTIHILDHHGVIRFKNLTADEIDAAIEKLLEEAMPESKPSEDK